jgi:manganese transport protein
METAINEENNNKGWTRHSPLPSLPEVHHSLSVPNKGNFFRQLMAFIGPGYLVAVGYMDPEN